MRCQLLCPKQIGPALESGPDSVGRAAVIELHRASVLRQRNQGLRVQIVPLVVLSQERMERLLRARRTELHHTSVQSPHSRELVLHSARTFRLLLSG